MRRTKLPRLAVWQKTRMGKKKIKGQGVQKRTQKTSARPAADNSTAHGEFSRSEPSCQAKHRASQGAGTRHPRGRRGRRQRAGQGAQLAKSQGPDPGKCFFTSRPGSAGGALSAAGAGSPDRHQDTAFQRLPSTWFFSKGFGPEPCFSAPGSKTHALHRHPPSVITRDSSQPRWLSQNLVAAAQESAF